MKESGEVLGRYGCDQSSGRVENADAERGGSRRLEGVEKVIASSPFQTESRKWRVRRPEHAGQLYAT